MIIAIDFDGTLVTQDRPYDDVTTPPEFMPGAKEAVLSLKRAEHILILYSGRANLALRKDWRRNPLWRNLIVKFNESRWEKNREINEARYQQMVEFVTKELPGVFDSIDDGSQGKVSADLFIDDRNFAFKGEAGSWDEIRGILGEEAQDVADELEEV